MVNKEVDLEPLSSEMKVLIFNYSSYFQKGVCICIRVLCEVAIKLLIIIMFAKALLVFSVLTSFVFLNFCQLKNPKTKRFSHGEWP
ncbi:unnamed protein product [Citrullus colocynthis]|uniref:Uncharacterized protein n=1 Tax=Citrullus colocynthis TaxID=252529 RepID=A0ABP0XRK8_9ROSI